jgi:hypothetical protein
MVFAVALLFAEVIPVRVQAGEPSPEFQAGIQRVVQKRKERRMARLARQQGLVLAFPPSGGGGGSLLGRTRLSSSLDPKDVNYDRSNDLVSTVQAGHTAQGAQKHHAQVVMNSAFNPWAIGMMYRGGIHPVTAIGSMAAIGMHGGSLTGGMGHAGGGHR